MGYGRRARELADQALREVEGPRGDASSRLALIVRTEHARLHGKEGAELEYRRELVERYPDEIQAKLNLASVLERRRSTAEEALAMVESGIQLDPQDPRTQMLRARLLTRLQRWEDARSSIATARTLFEQVKSAPGLAEIEKLRGDLAYRQRRFEEAAALYRGSAEAFGAAGLEALAAAAGKAAGDAELMRGRLHAAQLLYEPALRTALEHGQIRAVVNARNSLGAKLYLEGRIEEAEPLLRQAVSQARELERPRMATAPLLNLANLLNYTGRIREGEDVALEALDMARLAGDSAREIRARIMIADASYQQGKIEEAARAYRELLVLQRSKSASSASLGYSLASLTEVLLALGETGEALGAIEEALGSYREQAEDIDLGYGLLLRSEVRAQLALWDEAEADLAEAEALARNEERELGDLMDHVVLGRGRNALRRGRWGAAEGHLAQARRSGEASEVVNLLVPALVSSCEFALARGDAERALSWCREALERDRAIAADRTRARAGVARALALNGEMAAAEREARRALDDASAMGLLLETARAAGTLLSLEPAPMDQEALGEQGRRAMAKYLEAVPPDRRAAVRARPDLAETMDRLGLAGSGEAGS
jgi:tetratricopeptide (TPR) repeat protein